MINLNISTVRDIVEQNKICPFCYSDILLSAELALTKRNSTFKIINDNIIFDVDQKYFSHANININNQEFDIQKINTSSPGIYINYKSASFQRICYFCPNNFTIKYSKFKFNENKIVSLKIELIHFKFFYDNNNKILFNITNNYNSNETNIKRITFNNEFVYELKEDINLPMVNFDFSSKENILDKINSILLFL